MGNASPVLRFVPILRGVIAARCTGTSHYAATHDERRISDATRGL